jgi:hypothetical protein
MSDTTLDRGPGTHEPDDAGHGHPGHDDPGQPDGIGGHGAHGPQAGPVDWGAWGAGILGVGAGLAVAFCLYVATNL